MAMRCKGRFVRRWSCATFPVDHRRTKRPLQRIAIDSDRQLAFYRKLRDVRLDLSDVYVARLNMTILSHIGHNVVTLTIALMMQEYLQFVPRLVSLSIMSNVNATDFRGLLSLKRLIAKASPRCCFTLNYLCRWCITTSSEATQLVFRTAIQSCLSCKLNQNLMQDIVYRRVSLLPNLVSQPAAAYTPEWYSQKVISLSIPQVLLWSAQDWTGTRTEKEEVLVGIMLVSLARI